MKEEMRNLCRQLKPVLGRKIDRLWKAYLAESEPGGKADIEQTMELLAAKHLNKDYQPDRSPFPPPSKKFSQSGDIQLGKILTGFVGDDPELYLFLVFWRAFTYNSDTKAM